MFNGWKRSVAVVALGLLSAVALGACGGAVPADVLGALPEGLDVSSSGTEMAFSGGIQAMESDGWTVEGVSFSVDGSTAIKGDFAVGDRVKVHLTLDSASGTLLATEIEPASPETAEPSGTDQSDDGTPEATEAADATQQPETSFGSEDFEFIGVVNAMGDGTWTINDKTVTVADQTEINDTITLGDTVKVEAQVSLDGVITAREIRLASSKDVRQAEEEQGSENDGIEVKIRGTVETYGDGSITINGQSISLLPSTRIEGVLAVGVSAEVEALMGTDGTLVAKSVEVKSDSEMESKTTTDYEQEMENESESDDHHDGQIGEESESDSSGHHDDGGSTDD
jgi:hypothetical protein